MAGGGEEINGPAIAETAQRGGVHYQHGSSGRSNSMQGGAGHVRFRSTNRSLIPLWRPRRSKSEVQGLTFEEQRRAVGGGTVGGGAGGGDASGGIGAMMGSVASAGGSLFGSFFGSGNANAGPGGQSLQNSEIARSKKMMGKSTSASQNQQPSEIMVNFESMVKNCQVELVEWASCVIDQVKK